MVFVGKLICTKLYAIEDGGLDTCRVEVNGAGFKCRAQKIVIIKAKCIILYKTKQLAHGRLAAVNSLDDNFET